jgi:peptide/nickel transport system substrate-binding protein
MSSTDAYRAWRHARISRRAGIRVAALGAAGAWLAACGGGSSKGGGEQVQSGASATVPAQKVATAAGPARRGGTIAYRQVGTPPLDPFNNPTYRAQYQAGFVYSRLLKFKSGLDPKISYNYEVEPDLAASVELPGDGTQVTFKLRPEATFHDKPPVNGRSVTSEDVKFSLDRFRTAPKNTNKAAFGTTDKPIVQAVETPDPQTVVVKLAKPYAPIQNLFANPQYLWIMPKEADGGFNPDTEQIGSGPFMLSSVQPDVAVEVKRNPKWFVQDRPYVDGAKAVIILDNAQMIAQFQAGRLDIAAIAAEDKDTILQSNPSTQAVAYLPTTYEFISPQQRENSPFRDERVRRALSMAIDRDSWLELVFLGQGGRYQNFVPASMGKWWLDPQGKEAGDAAKWFTFDPKEAKKLLEAAGFAKQNFRYIFPNNAYGDRFNQAAEATSQMLSQAGFNPTIVTQDYLREYIDAKGTFFGNYEGVFYARQTPFTDPHDYLFATMHSASTRNHAGIKDPQLDKMIEDEEQTLDENERVKKVQDIQRYVMDKMYYIPTGVGFAYTVLQPWMQNYQHSATYGFGTESYVHLWVNRE